MNKTQKKTVTFSLSKNELLSAISDYILLETGELHTDLSYVCMNSDGTVVVSKTYSEEEKKKETESSVEFIEDPDENHESRVENDTMNNCGVTPGVMSYIKKHITSR
jgi:hypothetical protein